MISHTKMAANLGNNHVVFYPNVPGVAPLLGEALTQDNQFNSNPGQGYIQYTLPSIHELLGMGEEAFDFESVSVEVRVISIEDDGS